MDTAQIDLNRELMLDGNAVGGLFDELFGEEMTTAPGECAHCGHVADLGAFLAFTQGPGIVLRCPACEEIVLRIVKTDRFVYLDARGLTYLRLARRDLS